MNHETLMELISRSHRQRVNLIARKNKDYATEDVLSNFKRVAEYIKILRIDATTPIGVALIYAVLKIDRLTNLIHNGTEPMNESMADTFDDLMNYIDLARALLDE